MKNNYNPLDCECKITALLLNIAQKKTVSDETAFYFDIGQKMLIRALDQQQRAPYQPHYPRTS
jgi:hypothetical protein